MFSSKFSISNKFSISSKLSIKIKHKSSIYELSNEIANYKKEIRTNCSTNIDNIDISKNPDIIIDNDKLFVNTEKDEDHAKYFGLLASFKPEFQKNKVLLEESGVNLVKKTEEITQLDDIVIKSNNEVTELKESLSKLNDEISKDKEITTKLTSENTKFNQ